MTKVLLIEDEPQHVELVTLRLKRQGMEVTSALTGTGGVAAAEAQHPDVILLDLILPDMPPEAAIKALRAASRGTKTPIIAFTALDYTEIRRRGLDKKIAGLIPKPYETSQLLSEIKRIMNK